MRTDLVGEESCISEVLQRDRDTKGEDEQQAAEEEDIGHIVRCIASGSNDDASQILAVILVNARPINGRRGFVGCIGGGPGRGHHDG